ncbi:hypothetical protein P5673_008634 [Acropora cervicornis]|uniref:Uncharacterized protein n=1 Tax=Acropora cervicornis TaxID=6130 RepID=A0AAD9QSU3_ACRCE|nr:hypothetical protein P5673_008634 [Acropora cervicornis]
MEGFPMIRFLHELENPCSSHENGQSKHSLNFLLRKNGLERYVKYVLNFHDHFCIKKRFPRNQTLRELKSSSNFNKTQKWPVN